jgi:undecaprenyl diphosphate synthase
MTTKLPSHIAIIMDGNGRWARRRMLPRTAGHRAGVKAARAVVETCGNMGVQALTLFAFSSENWRRPVDEVGALMKLFLHTLRAESRQLDRNGVRLRIIGDRSAFPEPLQREVAAAEALTAQNTGLQLNIAANYGGRWDILKAAKAMLEDVLSGRIDRDQIDETRFSAYLSLAELPEPDLFIRTGGEQRVSNFLLWQLAYTELYFTETLWPDFDARCLEEAIGAFATRQRRFGRTSEQVERRESA